MIRSLHIFHEHHPRFLDTEVKWKPLDIPDSEIAAAPLELADAELAVAHA